MAQNNNITRTNEKPNELNDLISLYHSVGWTRCFTFPNKPETAIQNSIDVISSYQGNHLIGLIRGLSDGEFIHYIQDLLVFPKYTRMGIGCTLLKKALGQYTYIQKYVLLRDNELYQTIFYESLGFKNLNLIQPKLNGYILMEEQKLPNTTGIS